MDVEAIGQTSKTKGNKKDLEARIRKIVDEPLTIDVDKITEEEAKGAQEILLSSFELFSIWSFQIQMGFAFQKQDFHSIIFDVGQKIVDGVYDRVVVTIPPRHSKTQLLSIFLPLFILSQSRQSQYHLFICRRCCT